MGLALYCHGELKLTNGRNGRNGRQGRYKKEDGVVPTSLVTPPMIRSYPGKSMIVFEFESSRGPTRIN